MAQTISTCERTQEERDVQRMQTPDTMPLSNGSSHERNEGATSLAKPTNPPNSSSQDPRRENARRSVHRNGVHGPQEHADKGNRDGVADE